MVEQVPIDEHLPDHPGIRKALHQWLCYRMKIKKPYKNPVQQLALLVKQLGHRVIEAVEHSIAQGYQGCFLPGGQNAQAADAKTAESEPVPELVKLISSIMPDYYLWYKKLPKGIQDDYLNQLQLLIGHLDKSLILDALRGLAGKDKVKRWSDLPQLILDWLHVQWRNPPAKNGQTDQPTFCTVCANRGFILLERLHPVLGVPIVNTAFCTCQIGQKRKDAWQARYPNYPMATYNSQIHQRLD